MEEFVLKAQPRREFGSRPARRMRREGRLPTNVYGHEEKNLALTLDTKEFLSFFEAGHRIAVLDIDGQKEHGVLKEVQYDPLGSSVVHVDFVRVSQAERIRMEVPVETIGTPKSLAGGAVLEFPLRELPVEGMAKDIPEHIEISIEALGIGDEIRVRDVPVPAGCEIVADPELVVVAVKEPRGAAEVAAPEEPSEPEVISRGESETEGGAADGNKS